MKDVDYAALSAAMKTQLNSPEFKKAVEERRALMAREEEVIEEAAWFGKTGLSDDLERELPRYLRREYGQSLFDEGSLKAAELTYLGSFPERGMTIHYWRINDGESEPHYAYIEIKPNGGSVTGWGGSRVAPPIERHGA